MAMTFCAKHNSNCRYWRERARHDKPLEFLRWFFGTCLRRELLEFLHNACGVFLHAYLGAVVAGFFFSQSLPKVVIDLTDELAGPYIGALGLYFVLKKLLRREGKIIPRSAGEIFFIVWVVLLIVATGLTLFSTNFHFGETYTVIVKNSLAAIIFRIGMSLR